jgi:hypothetical protein
LSYSHLQNLINYTPEQSELCKITGVKQSTMSNRSSRNSDFTSDEIVMLNKYYNVNLFTNDSEPSKNNIYPFPGDRIEIAYWSELPEELKKKTTEAQFIKDYAQKMEGRVKLARTGFTVLFVNIAMQILMKRIITPLFATPMASFFKERFEKAEVAKKEKEQHQLKTNA